MRDGLSTAPGVIQQTITPGLQAIPDYVGNAVSHGG